MLAYKYDKDTKEYKGIQQAQVNPLEGGYLLPANCTFVEAPKYNEGEIPVFENDLWAVKADNRGKWQVKLSDVNFSKVDYIGEKEGYQVISDEVYEDYQKDNDKYKVVDGVFTDISDTEEYKEKKRQEKEQAFNEQFFNTSLGYVRRNVTMKDGTVKNFLTDILPLLAEGVPVLVYSKDLEQTKVAVANAFIYECKQQLLKDFYGEGY